MNAYRNAALPYIEAAQDVEPVSDAPVGGTPAVERRPQGTGSTLPAVRHDEIDRTRSRAALAAIDRALDIWAEDADRLFERGDKTALADGLHVFREMRKRFRDLEQHVEDYVAGLMEQDVENLSDEFTLERHRGRTRKQWQSVELLRALVGDQLVDPETGENVFGKLVACLPLTGSMAWRVTALRELGIQPSDWCVEEPARTTVAIRARSGQ